MYDIVECQSVHCVQFIIIMLSCYGDMYTYIWNDIVHARSGIGIGTMGAPGGGVPLYFT